MYQQFYEKKAGFYTEDKEVASRVSAERPDPLPNPNLPGSAGPKVSCLVSPTPSRDEITFLQQMGVTHVFTWIAPEQSNAAFLRGLNRTLKEAGLVLYNVGNRHVG